MWFDLVALVTGRIETAEEASGSCTGCCFPSDLPVSFTLDSVEGMPRAGVGTCSYHYSEFEVSEQAFDMVLLAFLLFFIG